MKASDVMTWGVISVDTETPVVRAAQLMLHHRVSGLPVVDANGDLVGIVTEGDFLRRGELGTQRQRPRWLQFLIGPGRLANEYVRACGRKVGEIMTPNPQAITGDTPVVKIVELMEKNRIKRLPVVDGRKVIGVVSRANLLHALASIARDAKPPAGNDAAIRDQIVAELKTQTWAPEINVVVRNGVVELWGIISDERERQAFVVAAENVPGVKRVHDHLAWIDTSFGLVLQAEEDAAQAEPAQAQAS
jgi:CBS domain-containing protein